MTQLISMLYLTLALIASGEDTWFADRIKDLEVAKTLPKKQQIDRLGDLVRIGRVGAGTDAQKIQVFETAQAALLAIPGNVERFRDEINAAQDGVKRAREISPPDYAQISVERANFMEVQDRVFQILHELPSADTVSVLGEMLSDEYGRVILDGTNLDYYFEQSVNADRAADLLDEMLENPPTVRNRAMSFPELKPWRQWYAEIKAGRRTFRFKGDPQEYSLKGPVSTGRNPTIEKAIRHSAPPVAQKESNTAEHAQSSEDRAPYFIGAIVALLGLAAYLWQRRKKRVSE